MKLKFEELEKQLREEKEKNRKESNAENINNLNKKKELDEISEKYNKIIDEKNKNIGQQQRENISLYRELNRYPIKLSINEKLISIIFFSSDENIQYPIICKNTDDFRRLEKLFFIKYPEYKYTICDFYINGKIINRMKNLKENKINDGDKILFKNKEK